MLENVALPGVLDGTTDADARNGAHAALELLDLDELADKLPEEISGGQAQRVAVARAVAGSNLTAVELSGLTKVELGFALVLAAAATWVRARARLPGAPADVRDRERAGRQGAPARRLRVERVGLCHRSAAWCWARSPPPASPTCS